MAVPAQLMLGNIGDLQPRNRFDTWIHRLSAEGPTTPAQDLYSGEHWNIARNLPALVGGHNKLWICSAGYGLIRDQTNLQPYMATFTPGNRDSVGRSRVESVDWWRRLTDWPGPQSDQPRSFADLARRDPDATIIAILSNTYLYACAEDLRVAKELLRSKDRFVVMGANQAVPELEDVVIPIPARLRSVVGGSLHALQVRAAAHLLPLAVADSGDLGLRSLRVVAQRAIDNSPVDPSRRAPGVRMDDRAVREYIDRHRHVASVSATKLLRQLRESGFSCEQGRFKKLFHETMQEVAA
ncbi:hypothetical protein [Nocardia beijingensis]|uniref:hypothetical protein n=1 Tax=Nocardia beijingensis TaxID=95162 RepID=UPI0033A052AB